MSSSSIRLVLVVALCFLLPPTVSGQRLDGRIVGVSAGMRQPRFAAERRGLEGMGSADRPSLGRHTLYGALAGAVLWGVYLALPCDGGCDGSRAERLVLLPAFAGIGASAGFVTGLVRGAR